MAGRLDVERRPDGVALIWLDNPGQRNAISAAIITALLEQFAALGADPGCRVVVLRGRGGVFCVGRELNELLALQRGPTEAVRANYLRVLQLNEAVQFCRRPTIAVVEGAALGFGSILTSWCDIALAAEDAVFGYPEVKRGFAPTTAVPPLALGLPRKAAADLLLTGRKVPAQEALRMGLVSRCLPRAGLDQALEECLGELLQCEPEAVAVTKGFLRQCDEAAGYRALLAATVDSVSLAVASEAGREGISAFLEKRPARWARKPT